MDVVEVKSLMSKDHIEQVAVNLMHSKPEKVYKLSSAALENDPQRIEVIKSHMMDLSQLNAIQLKNWLDNAIENNLFDE